MHEATQINKDLWTIQPFSTKARIWLHHFRLTRKATKVTVSEGGVSYKFFIMSSQNIDAFNKKLSQYNYYNNTGE